MTIDSHYLTLHDGARQIMLGDSQVALIGGVEHMGHVPMTYNTNFNPSQYH